MRKLLVTSVQYKRDPLSLSLLKKKARDSFSSICIFCCWGVYRFLLFISSKVKTARVQEPRTLLPISFWRLLFFFALRSGGNETDRVTWMDIVIAKHAITTNGFIFWEKLYKRTITGSSSCPPSFHRFNLNSKDNAVIGCGSARPPLIRNIPIPYHLNIIKTGEF